ncbi:hypothetical protein BDZ97DRAFT_1760718 [Flammula alnicola]|nr:hypothetical protein BDZ97DRAFT_1760718 [Flammula alnicola]
MTEKIVVVAHLSPDVIDIGLAEGVEDSGGLDVVMLIAVTGGNVMAVLPPTSIDDLEAELELVLVHSEDVVREGGLEVLDCEGLKEVVEGCCSLISVSKGGIEDREVELGWSADGDDAGSCDDQDEELAEGIWEVGNSMIVLLDRLLETSVSEETTRGGFVVIVVGATDDVSSDAEATRVRRW